MGGDSPTPTPTPFTYPLDPGTFNSPTSSSATSALTAGHPWAAAAPTRGEWGDHAVWGSTLTPTSHPQHQHHHPQQQHAGVEQGEGQHPHPGVQAEQEEEDLDGLLLHLGVRSTTTGSSATEAPDQQQQQQQLWGLSSAGSTPTASPAKLPLPSVLGAAPAAWPGLREAAAAARQGWGGRAGLGGGQRQQQAEQDEEEDEELQAALAVSDPLLSVSSVFTV